MFPERFSTCWLQAKTQTAKKDIRYDVIKWELFQWVHWHGIDVWIRFLTWHQNRVEWKCRAFNSEQKRPLFFPSKIVSYSRKLGVALIWTIHEETPGFVPGLHYRHNLVFVPRKQRKDLFTFDEKIHNSTLYHCR